MTCGDITSMVFLKRVSYRDGKLCEEMLQFNTLSNTTADDNEDNEFNDDNVETDVNIDQEKNDALMCQSCFARNRDCFMEPCCHVYFCMECYERWLTVNPNSFEPQYADLTAEELLVLEPLQNPKCPVCREPVTSGKKLLMS